MQVYTYNIGVNRRQTTRLNESIIFHLIFISVALVLMLTSLSIVSCTEPVTVNMTEAEIAAVRAYADPATETTLRGLSADDIAQYTRYFNEATKAAVTAEIVHKTASQLNAQLGRYVSKEYRRIEQKSGYIIVHYRAKYDRGEVGIRMVFDSNQLVAGQWFE